MCGSLLFGSCFKTRSDPELMILLPHSLLSAGIISHLAELSFSKAHKVQGKPPWWKTLWGGGQGHGSVDTPGTGVSFCGHQGLAHFQSRLRWSSALNNGAPFYISDRLSSLPSSLPSFLSPKSPHPTYWSLYPLLPPYSTVPTSPETFRVTSL